MEEIELPELTATQLEILCSTAQDAARKHVLSKAALKSVESLNVCVEAERSKTLKPTNRFRLSTIHSGKK